MTGRFQTIGRALPGRGSVYLAAILVLVVMAAAMGIAIYNELRALREPQDDIGWAVFQLGLEHQRLQLAVETDQPVKDILLRGDIYLSRVALVRDAPAMASLRHATLQPGLEKLIALAEKTEVMLDAIAKGGDAAFLLRQLKEELREDAPVIRAVTVDMSNFTRDQLASTRASRTQQLLSYLTILELLLLGMLALAAFAWRVNVRLQWAGRAIEQQKATLEAILNSVDDAIVGIGEKGEFLYSNPRAAELLWLRRGSQAVTLHTMRQDDPLVRGIKALVDEPAGDLSGRGLAGLCAISLAAEGQTRHYEIRKFLPQRVEGAEQGSSAIISIADVTLEVESARKRDEYDSRIADLSRVHSYAAISGGIVHEISQPLAAIKNYIHALKAALEGRQSKAERMNLADMAGEEVDRAIQVVRNVRRLVGPQGLTDTGSCDVREAVAHAIRLVNMGRNPVPPIAVKAPDHAVVVSGSLPLIGQVLVNLLRNGLEASQANGQSGAGVTITETGEFAEVAVSDFGSGVSPAAAQTLFTPFSMSSHGGMGLGLAICKRIADTVGGSLSWHNAASGAVFTFAIPLIQEEHHE